MAEEKGLNGMWSTSKVILLIQSLILAVVGAIGFQIMDIKSTMVTETQFDTHFERLDNRIRTLEIGN